MMLLVVLGLVIITGIFAYQRFTEIVEGIAENARPDMRLVTAKSLVNDIVSAENSVKSFTLTKDTAHLNYFYLAAASTRVKMHELRRFNDRGNRPVAGLDTLDKLINLKFQILRKFLIMQDEFRVQVALDKVLKRIELAADIADVRASVHEKKSGDSTRQAKNKEDVEESTDRGKKGFLTWLFRSEKRGKEEPGGVVAVEDELTEIPVIEDPLPEEKSKESLVTLNEVNSGVREVKKEERSIEQGIRERELEYIMADNVVKAQINEWIRQLEEAELEYINDKTREAGLATEETNKQIALFCIATGILIMLTAFIIINYVRNSRRYKKALKRAKEEAESHAIAKERFMANMSHEIRTPMNALGGFIEQIADGPLTAGQREQLSMVRKSAEHLQYLVNDVLVFSKLKSGKVKLENIPFRPYELMDEILQYFRKQVDEKGLSMRWESNGEIPAVLRGDPFRLRQILLNIIGNAVKFTDAGEIEIRLSVNENTGEGLRLKIAVIDSGIGMEEGQTGRLFHAFEQAASSTARLYGGSGLGLSITKMLVELHGGVIEIRSMKNVGTSVYIEIPYIIGSIEELAEEEKQEVRSGSFLRGKRVLIVDDEVFNRKLLSTILGKHGAILTEASDGMEALEKVKSGIFDLILMDARMPRLSGVEATREIRRLKEAGKRMTPIIALTAQIFDSDRAEYIRAGMNAFLAKPFKEANLLGIISPVLHNGRGPSNGEEASKKNDDRNYKRINLSELDMISNGDKHFLNEMLDIFLREARICLANMRSAFLSGDWNQIAEEAHKLSAPARHLSAMELHTILKEIENNCRASSQLNEIEGLLEQAEKESQMVEREIEVERKYFA